MPFEPASTALSRFKVLDLTRVRSGPTCVRQLADWGADVIKIEPPAEQQKGDQVGGKRLGSDFQSVNRNKRALSLDLKSDEGKAVFLRLVERADVVVENFRPDVMDRLGLGYEALSKVNPRLVYAQISGFGADGPYARRPGFDQIAQGMGGLMSITGEPGRGPMRVGIPIADLTAGLYCAIGVMVALLSREETGRGQRVSTSLLAAQIAMLDFQATRWLIDGERPPQAGNNHPTTIPTGVFETADGHINIAVTGNVIWQRFCAAIEAPGLAQDPLYAKAADRSTNRDALAEEIARRTRTKTSAEWIDAFNAAGVPAGPIYHIDEMFDDPQVKHLGLAQSVTSPQLGEITLVAHPVVLSDTDKRIARAAPEIGEHSDEILAELGYAPDEIAALREGGTI